MARAAATADSAEPAPDPRGWTAVVLAGSRAETDELTQSFGVPLKALTPVAGQPMVGHVVRTLLDSPSISRIVVVAQTPELLVSGELEWIGKSQRVGTAPSGAGIADSIMRIAGTEAAPWPVLITTADHPLLTVEMIEHFLGESLGSDLSIGVVDKGTLLRSYPQSRRTWLKFKGGDVTGANLFAGTSAGIAEILKVMATVEADRKNQLKMLRGFGLLLTVGSLVRLLTVEQAARRGGSKFGLRVNAVRLPFAEAGIDVDRLADHAVVSRIFAERALPSNQLGSVRLSIFDLDQTITRRGTYTSFLLFAARRKRPARLLLAPLAIPLFAQYVLKGTTRTRLKERLQRLFLGPRMKRHDVEQLAAAFARRLGSGGFFADAVERIEKERSAGRRIILATAANGFYAEAIASALGIEEVVSTRSHWQDDHLLARIDGENCHGENKARMVSAYLEDAGLARRSLHVRVFTDHKSDVPLLRWADEAFIVNPRGKFRAEAKKAGWPILSWR